MKKFRQILSLFLVIAMLCGMMVFPVSADEILPITGGETITADGTYQLAADATGVITVAEGVQNVTIIGNGAEWDEDPTSATHGAITSTPNTNLGIDCTAAPGITLTIQDMYVSNSSVSYNGIDFLGEGNTLVFDGTVIWDLTSGAVGYASIHVPAGTGLTVYGTTGSRAYFYKTEQAAGIGGDWREGCGEITFGLEDGANDFYFFMKGSKQGAVIGNGAACSDIPGNITFNSGIYNLLGIARGAIISGSAGADSEGAGNVFVNGGLINMNVDFSGAAIGGGGYAEGNDKAGGLLYVSGGSVRTYIDSNAVSSWSGYGVTEAGVNDAAITAGRVNANGEDVYLLTVDTTEAQADAYTIEVDGETFYEGPNYSYSYYLEDANRDTDGDGSADLASTPNGTPGNWVVMEEPCFYLYVTGEDHTVTVNGVDTAYTWDATNKTFTASSDVEEPSSGEVVLNVGNLSADRGEAVVVPVTVMGLADLGVAKVELSGMYENFYDNHLSLNETTTGTTQSATLTQTFDRNYGASGGATSMLAAWTATITANEGETLTDGELAHFGFNVSDNSGWVKDGSLYAMTITSAVFYDAEGNVIDTTNTYNNGGVSIDFPDYRIDIAATENGTVTAPATAHRQDTVTLTVTPDVGYVLDTLSVVDAEGNNIYVTDYSFLMPACDVTVTATFAVASDDGMIHVTTWEQIATAIANAAEGEELVFCLDADVSMPTGTHYNFGSSTMAPGPNVTITSLTGCTLTCGSADDTMSRNDAVFGNLTLKDITLDMGKAFFYVYGTLNVDNVTFVNGATSYYFCLASVGTANIYSMTAEAGPSNAVFTEGGQINFLPTGDIEIPVLKQWSKSTTGFSIVEQEGYPIESITTDEGELTLTDGVYTNASGSYTANNFSIKLASGEEEPVSNEVAFTVPTVDAPLGGKATMPITVDGDLAALGVAKIELAGMYENFYGNHMGFVADSCITNQDANMELSYTTNSGAAGGATSMLASWNATITANEGATLTSGELMQFVFQVSSNQTWVTDGSEFPVTITSAVLYDAEGNVIDTVNTYNNGAVHIDFSMPFVATLVQGDHGTVTAKLADTEFTDTLTFTSTDYLYLFVNEVTTDDGWFYAGFNMTNDFTGEVKFVDYYYFTQVPLANITITPVYVPARYMTIDAEKTVGGTVTRNRTLNEQLGGTAVTKWCEGDEISFKCIADEGYEIVNLWYSYVDPTTGETVEQSIAVTNVIATSIIMPDADIVVWGEFKRVYAWYENGAETGSYTISTAEELAQFAAIVNGTDEACAQDSFAGKTVTLAGDIDLSTVCSADLGTWNAIGGATTNVTLTLASQEELDAALAEYILIYDDLGNSYKNGTGNNNPYSADRTYYYVTGAVFSGTFDGAGHTISNLYVNVSTGYAGLFGNINGTVKNFTVNGSVISSTNWDFVGGVTGKLSLGGRIEGVTSYVDVSAPSCYNVGGIAGCNGSKGSFESADNTFIVNCANYGNVTGYQATGGIAGHNAAQIQGCANFGEIHSARDYGKAGTGGIVGRNGENNTASDTGTVINCYNAGKIYTDSKWVGGIVGFNPAKSSVINCYNSGTVSGGGQTNPIVGQNEASGDFIVKNCWYLDSTKGYDQSGVYGGNQSNCGPKTDAELRAVSMAALLGDAFQATCGGYPVLTWQTATAHVEGEMVVENIRYATCTETGSYDEVVYCTTCAAEISRNTVITPALGHSYVDGTHCDNCDAAIGWSGELSWSFENGTLTFSGEGLMKKYTYKSETPWYAFREKVTTVVLPEGVTRISGYAFYGMTNLTDIQIPSTVTIIGDYAFKNCVNVTALTLPEGLTSIGDSAFYGTGLTAIEIPASVCVINEYAFKGCTALASVTLNEGLTTIEKSAFYGCSGLTEIVIPASVTSIEEYAFAHCTALASVEILGTPAKGFASFKNVPGYNP